MGQTVSSGIISGLARSGGSGGNGTGYFIQTDAPINPGNSGGALIDMAGRLIGINTSILTRSGGSNGIGFAIPSDLVAEFVTQAKAGNDRFHRAWAGVSGQVLDYDMAASFGLDRSGEIIITELHPASPFGAAGFEVGDVITAIDGQPVISGGEMLFRMSVGGIGNTAVVTRTRNGEASDVTVELISAPDYPPRDFTVLGEDAILAGLELALINPAVSDEMGLSTNAAGVVVVNTAPIAARVGLRRGDIIEAVNSKVVETPSDVREGLTNSGRGVRLDIIRGGSRVQLRFRL